MKNLIRGQSARSFMQEESGNAAMIFGLAFVPMMLLVGLATDYSNLAATRTTLQQGTDSATLAVAAAMTRETTLAQAQKQAQARLNSDPRLRLATVTKVTIDDDKRTFCAWTQMSMEGAFTRLARIDMMNLGGHACAKLAGGVDPKSTYEIALVLDNSGSMARKTDTGESKLVALQKAAKSFVDTMTSKSPGKVGFSVVPFAAGVVAVDPTVNSNRNRPWIDTKGENSQHWVAFGGQAAATAAKFKSRFDIYDILKKRNAQLDWRGCFEEPTYPRNVNADSLSPSDAESLLVPYLAPDEPDNKSAYSNSYLNDNGRAGRRGASTCSDTASGDWNALSRACKYLQTSALNDDYGPGDGFGPNQSCPDHRTQTLLQTTTSQTEVKGKIDMLVAQGYTNLHSGFMWGWRSIGPGLPFGGNRGYGAANNRKIMVFMTDGFNNWSSQEETVVGSGYESLGYYTYNGANNARLSDGSGGDGVNYQSWLAASANKSERYVSESRKALDNLTLEACANAKAAGIEVFTIGFSIPTDPIDEQGLSLLRACATNVEHYFPASNVAELNAAFDQIGIGLGSLRLSN